MRSGFKYSGDFKAAVAREVLEKGKRVTDVAIKYNLGSPMVSNWVAEYRVETAHRVPKSDDEQLQQPIVPFRRKLNIPFNNFTVEFKAKIALEALMGNGDYEELIKRYKVSRTSISTWKGILRAALAMILEKSEHAEPVVEAKPKEELVEVKPVVINKSLDVDAFKESVRKLLESI